MRIDNRFLLPFLAPFALLFLIRLIFFAAGAEWARPEDTALISLVFGMAIGTVAAIFLFVDKIEIGHITIGKSTRPEDENDAQ